MKAWEELTELEQAQANYSDTFKDFYGFRPCLSPDSWDDLDFLNREIRWMSENMIPLDHSLWIKISD